MNNSLEQAIEKIKIASNGERYRIPAPDDNIINRYKSKHNITIYDDHRTILKKASNILYGGIELLTITENENSRRELYPAYHFLTEQNCPEGWVPIAEDNGDYYCITPQSEVRFWSHNGTNDEVWDSVADWVIDVWLEGN